MKILIYSDLHCCYSTSILPIHCDGSQYTTRLQMIIDTGKWIAELARDNNVDLIVNGGDTFDSNVLRSEEVSAMSEFFSYFDDDIRHIVIMGNHEQLDSTANFHTANAFKNIHNVEVYDKPKKIDNVVSVLPYMKASDVGLSLLEELKNEFLISHIDIKGSCLRDDYVMDEGVDPEILSQYFTFVANGHLHTAERLNTEKNDVWNIGSVSSTSFVDNNNYHPSVCIYDTDTRLFKRYKNPYSILFRKTSVSSINEFIEFCNGYIKSKYRYVVRVRCQYSIRNDIRNIISNYDNIIASRVISSNYTPSEIKTESVITKINGQRDMKSEFTKYLENNPDVLNYPLDEYRKVIEQL